MNRWKGSQSTTSYHRNLQLNLKHSKECNTVVSSAPSLQMCPNEHSLTDKNTALQGCSSNHYFFAILWASYSFQRVLKPSSVAKKNPHHFLGTVSLPFSCVQKLPAQSWQATARTALIKYYTNQLNTFWSLNRQSLIKHGVPKTQQKHETSNWSADKVFRENKK